MGRGPHRLAGARKLGAPEAAKHLSKQLEQHQPQKNCERELPKTS
jgi:hypothetical protein